MYLNHICESCSCFTYLCELKIISEDNPVVATAFANSIFYLDQFDSCGCLFQLYIFYKNAGNALLKRSHQNIVSLSGCLSFIAKTTP